MFIQLAWRNIWRNPRRTAVILTAIIIGVASMIILAAFSRGMAGGMVENAIDNLVGHVKVQNPDYRSDPDVTHRLSSPKEIASVLKQALPAGSKVVSRLRVDGVASNAWETAGVEIVGIHPQDEKGVSFIGDAPLEGEMIAAGDRNGIVMGAALAEKFQTGVGKKLVLTTQQADGETGSRAFRIRGLFHAEMEALEKSYVFISHPAAARLIQAPGSATEIAAALPRVLDDDRMEALAEKCRNALAGFQAAVYTWEDLLPAMSAYLAMFDMFLYIWFVVVFIAMGFGIVNTVLMAVYERMREFGLLKALGMRPIWIVRMVMGESLFLLLAGCLAGTLLGLGVTYHLARTGIDLGAFARGVEMFGMSRIVRPEAAPNDLFAANTVVLLLGLAVSIYPAVKAARFTPLETMRAV